MADTSETERPGPFIGRLISWSAQHSGLVVLLAAALALAGWLAANRMALDALPDLTDTQVIIRTDYPGQAPQIVEDQVTFPLSSALLGLPRTQDVRGVSMFGTSFVHIVFEEDIDPYWARARVLEALSSAGDILPNDVAPRLGPDATGVGWVLQYILTDDSGTQDLADLRTLQDWFVRYELATVPGVAEVASIGGFVREYQVLIDPNRLRAFDVPLNRIAAAVRAASLDAGGGVLEMGEAEYLIRSTGYVDDVDALAQVVVKAEDGTPVQLGDMVRIVEGPAPRRGVAELNGQGEVVGGILVMRQGENALDVIRAAKERISRIERGLPEGVGIRIVYDRAPLIEDAVSYLRSKLVEEGLMVALVIFAFLLHVRSSVVAVIVLPVGVLAAFLVMTAQGVTANIMSLGGIAIAIGAMVDAAIVMVENAHRTLGALPADASPDERRKALIAAARQVGPGVFVSLLIITVSFLPVFALTGESYRLFAPLAFTKTYAMAFAAVLSVTLVPALMVLLLRGRMRSEMANPVNRIAFSLYRPILKAALKFRWATLVLAAGLLLVTALPLARTGTEFMPALYEGDLLYMPTTLPGVSVPEAAELLARTDRLIASVPEVAQVFGKAGRADTATDPAPISMFETWIDLKPRSQWRAGMDIDDLVAELDAMLQIPGLVNSWGYPIKIRMDMISTGIRTPVAFKVAGDDLATIGTVSRQIEQVLKSVPGTRSAFADRVEGARYITILPNRAELARRNIDLQDFQSVVRLALGGLPLTETVRGRQRIDITLRYARRFRQSLSDIRQMLVPTPAGQHIPLSELAKVVFEDGPPMIRSENARLNGWVFVDVSGVPLADYTEAALARIDQQVTLPNGVTVTAAGDYQRLQAASDRLSLAIPATLLVVFVLLYLYFGRLDRTFIVLGLVPLGLSGGVWAVWLTGYNFSVAVAVGFIALAGIALETAVIMILYLDQALQEQNPTTAKGLIAAVHDGALLRLRPKLMTVLTILLGLTPIFITSGLGADVMRRIALPMMGGLVTTVLVTLIVLPCLYALWQEQALPGVSAPEPTKET